MQKDSVPYKIIIVTPERAFSTNFLDKIIQKMVENNNLAYFAIDEAHVLMYDCEFRPEFNHANILRERFPQIPIIAVTATATPKTQAALITKLGMKEPSIFQREVNRQNISIQVRVKKPEKIYDQVATLVHTEFQNKCGFVYFMTQDECEGSAAALKSLGINAVCYYARLKGKETNQDKWTRGESKG